MAITPTFICGFECASVVAGSSAGHWTQFTTQPATTTTIVRTGTRALRVTASASQVQVVQQTGLSGTINVARFYIQLVSLPGANVDSLAGVWPSGATNGVMGYTQATGVLNIGAPGALTQGTTVLKAGTWYRIDWRWNLVANPWVIDWQVDGVDQPQAKPATAADSNGGLNLGTSFTNCTYDAAYDDAIASATSADYPIGPGNVQGYTIQTTSGTHVQTAGDLQDNTSTNITNGDGSGAKLQDRPADLTSFIKQVVLRTTSYAEYLYSGGATQNPRGVQQVVAVSLVSGTTGTEKSQLFDGTTATDAYATGTPGVTSLFWRQNCWATPPSGGSWTAALLNACRLRWGFSGNITGSPFVTFSILEAEFPDLAAVGAATVAFLSPLRRFGRPAIGPSAAGPTTWNVTLTESVQSADVWTRQGTFNRTDTELVQSADVWTRAGTFLRSIAASVQSADAWVRVGTFGRTLTESVQSSDVWTRSATFGRTLTEGVTNSDAWTRTGTFLRSWTESVQSSDSWTGIRVILRSWSESVQSSDVWTRTGTFLRSTSESVQSGDAWARTLTALRSTAESVQSADAWTRIGTFNRTLTEGVTSSDVWTGVKVILRSWSESVQSSDSWTRSGSFLRSTAESVTSSDVWTRTATYRRALAEAVQSFDTWVAVAPSHIIGIPRAIASDARVALAAIGDALRSLAGISDAKPGAASGSDAARGGISASDAAPQKATPTDAARGGAAGTDTRPTGASAGDAKPGAALPADTGRGAAAATDAAPGKSSTSDTAPGGASTGDA